MITKDNLLSIYPQFKANELPEALTNDFAFLSDNLDLYNEDDDIKQYIDTYIGKLNELAVKKGYIIVDDRLIKQDSKVDTYIKSNPNVHIVSIPKTMEIEDARSYKSSNPIYVMSKYSIQNEFQHVDLFKGRQTDKKVTIGKEEYDNIKEYIQQALKKKPNVIFRILEDTTDYILQEFKNEVEKLVLVSKRKNQKKYFPYSLESGMQVKLFDLATFVKSDDEKELERIKTLLDNLAITNPDNIYRIVKARNTNTVIYKTGSKPKKETKSKKPISKVGQPIEKLPADVAYIKRYIGMHGKVKTGDQVLNLLHSLQKAITERTLSKESMYCDEIEQIQEELIRCVESVNTSATIEIDAKRLEHYRSIVEQYQPMLSVTYLKKYISLNGKSGIKGKAQELAKLIKKAVDTSRIPKTDRYAKQLEVAYKNLVEFTDNTFVIEQAELNGLAGLDDADGLGFITPIITGVAANFITQHINKAIESPNKIVNSTELAGMHFETLPLMGEFKELIGTPSRNFSAMVYGMPGGGKTTWCIKFAKYLADYHNLKVLFASIEEGINQTAQDKFERLNAFHSNILLSNYMPDNLSMFDVVFIDSVNLFRYSTDDLRALRNRHPNMIVICIFQVTKEGKFKGSQEYEHDVDVVIRAENGIISTVGCKNRFGGGGKCDIW